MEEHQGHKQKTCSEKKDKNYETKKNSFTPKNLYLVWNVPLNMKNNKLFSFRIYLDQQTTFNLQIKFNKIQFILKWIWS